MAGLAAAGVDDAAARVAALEAQRQPALVVEVEDDAARLQLADRAGASSTSTWTAAGRQRPRPAAIVSAAWRAGESPGSSAAASPPWAQ